MSTEVRVCYDWTQEEMERAYLIWKREYAFSGKALYGTIFFRVMSVVYCMMFAVAVLQSWSARSIDGYLVYLVVFPLIVWVWIRSRNARNPDRNHPIRYGISSDRWVIESHTSRNEFLWSPVKSIVRVSEGFVVDLHDRSFRWLPIQGFESGTEIESFVRMTKSHDVKYEDRRAK